MAATGGISQPPYWARGRPPVAQMRAAGFIHDCRVWRRRLFPPACRTEHECGHCFLTTSALLPSHSLLFAHEAQERSLSLQ